MVDAPASTMGTYMTAEEIGMLTDSTSMLRSTRVKPSRINHATQAAGQTVQDKGDPDMAAVAARHDPADESQPHHEVARELVGPDERLVQQAPEDAEHHSGEEGQEYNRRSRLCHDVYDAREHVHGVSGVW